jgi:hypothetical protein
LRLRLRLLVLDVVTFEEEASRRSGGCCRSKPPPRTTKRPWFGHVTGRSNAARTE